MSPHTRVEVDATTGLEVEGSLKPLRAGSDVARLEALQLGPFHAPRAVPVDAVLVLRFSTALDASSLALREDGTLDPNGPVRVTWQGRAVPVLAHATGTDLILDARVGAAGGFPRASFSIGAGGERLHGSNGGVHLALATQGAFVLRGKGGETLTPRADLLGTPDAGGEAVVVLPGASGEDGLYYAALPGNGAPRILRHVRFNGIFQPAAGDQNGQTLFVAVLPVAFNTAAKGGLGEWAGGHLVLRPGKPREERHVVLTHSVAPAGGLFQNTFLLATPIEHPLQANEPWELLRRELFEPDPAHPIDPATFDPLNPELANNQDLLHFITARDRNGQVQDLTQPIDPLSSLEVRFTEAIDPDSLKPHESFRVTDDPDPINPGLTYLGRIELLEQGRIVVFRPEREVQFGPQAGTFEPVGFGPNPKALRVSLVSVPGEAELEALLGPAGAQDFLDLGVVGITDLEGMPLAFPSSFVSAQNPFVNYSAAFATQADAALAEHGALVHRFMGRPETAAAVTGQGPITGVRFHDVPAGLCGPDGNVYGNRIAEFNLLANGFLAGAPVQFIQKVHDDFNPPPGENLATFPFGASSPIGGLSVLGGARFQHVYRPVDASPDYEALNGTELHLYQLAFAPVSGQVTNTVLPDISIHAGHSTIHPDIKQAQGIPTLPNTGLTGVGPAAATVMGGHHQVLGDANTPFVEGPYNATNPGGEELRPLVVYGTETGVDDYQGKPFVIDNAQLFVPPGTQRPYHPLPHTEFDQPFVYDNGAPDAVAQFNASSGFTSQPSSPPGAVLGDPIPHTLVLEYRVRVTDPTDPPATNNGFTFAPGILSSALPRFRVFSIGAGCTSCCAEPCSFTCSTAIGPALTGLPGSGGPPLDPDLVKLAAGPDPAPPGMPCYCLKAPQSGISCPIPLTQTNTTAPSIDQVAYGQAANPTNNNHGDNSRYFMVFNYVKQRSTIWSPFVRAQPAGVVDPLWLAPIVRRPIAEQPPGTLVALECRASTNGLGTGADVTPWVTAEQMADPNNPLNNAGATPYLQFRITLEGNKSTLLTPAIDELVVPYRK